MGKFKLADLFSAGTLVEKVGDAINKNVTSKEEREKVRIELLKTLQDFEVDIKTLNLSNILSARDMHVLALGQEDVKSKRFIHKFSWFWAFSSMAYFTATTFIPVLNDRVADTILGFLLGTGVASILTFWYGSSVGSSDKSEMIDKILNKK